MIPHGTAKLVRVNYRLELSQTYSHTFASRSSSKFRLYLTPRISTFISNKNYFHLPQRKLINLSLVFIILYKLYTKICPEGVADNKYKYLTALLTKKITGLKQ